MATKVRDYTRFENYAQAIWESGDFTEKKELILEAIGKFEYKKKVDKFVDLDNRPPDNAAGRQKLDKLITDLVLVQSGDKVIR